MQDFNFNNIELDEEDKKIFEEIKRLADANSVGEALKCINHAVNGYLNRALLVVGNFQDGIFDTREKQKQAFDKIQKNSLKASLVAKELRKFYHL